LAEFIDYLLVGAKLNCVEPVFAENEIKELSHFVDKSHLVNGLHDCIVQLNHKLIEIFIVLILHQLLCLITNEGEFF